MNPEKILVFSDSHGSTLVMKALLQAPPEGLTAVFHLGDGVGEAELLMRHYPMYAFIGIKGNNDFRSDKPETAVTERGGVRFLLTHGHRYGVKSSLAYAAITAERENADFVLYGHTHIQMDSVVDVPSGEIRAVNPGSARSAEYAVITVDNGDASVKLKRYTSGGAG